MFPTTREKLLHTVLVDRLAHVQHLHTFCHRVSQKKAFCGAYVSRGNYLESALCDALNEGRVFDDLDRLAGDEVDVLLTVLHARLVVGQGRALLAIIVRRVVSKQFRDLGAVGRVFVDTQLDVASELNIRT